jgi:hypothetical protein
VSVSVSLFACFFTRVTVKLVFSLFFFKEKGKLAAASHRQPLATETEGEMTAREERGPPSAAGRGIVPWMRGGNSEYSLCFSERFCEYSSNFVAVALCRVLADNLIIERAL